MPYHQPVERGREQQDEPAARPRAAGPMGVLDVQRLAGNQAMRSLMTPVVVQRFESDEHLRLGDQGADRAHAEMVPLAPGYQVTYGEMIAMAGDFFGSLSQLQGIAQVPGTGAGTREEIEYVRVVKVHGDKSKKDSYSESAVRAADHRYYELALSNRSHFVNPEGEAGDTAGRAEGAHQELRLQWTGILPGFVSELVIPRAGAGYRHYHMEALFQAYVAGFEGQGIEGALAPEAFGAHYLTDAFSGGHLRTARSSIQDYWNPKVPMFGYNLTGWIAQELAARIGDAHWYGRDVAYHGVPWQAGAFEQVASKLAEKGALGFGDVVSGTIHDLDSERGVLADVNGQRIQLMGDGHLGGDTERVAVEAVNYSHNDLTRAWLIGRRRGPLQDVLPDVTAGKVLGAEQMLPNVVPDNELPDNQKSVQWEVASALDLLSDPTFQRGLRIFGVNKANELAEVANTLEPDVRPHFDPAVVQPFRTDPVTTLRKVLNWTPNTGGGLLGHNQDDNALDYYNEASGKNAVGTLTVKQRVDLIRNLLDGYTSGEEENAAFDILTANSSHSQDVIRQVGWDRLEDELGNRFSNRFPKSS
ncbi:hypothetical protein [Actinocrispum wychmicini]|nr:hypothetical protein [Actinocrispum wychmicini]